MELIRELGDTLSFASHSDGQECDEQIAAALLRLEQIQPRDPMEGMLGTQMVAAHSAAMMRNARKSLDDFFAIK